MPLTGALLRPKWRWPAIIIVLLMTHIVFCAVTVYLAVSEPTFATEPNYYRKALEWDRTAAQRQASNNLGWRLDIDISDGESGVQERVVRLRLVDRDGAPIDDAYITAEAFHHARSAERSVLPFTASADATWSAPLRVTRPGTWELRIRAVARGQSFVATRLLDILPAHGARP